MKFDDTMLQRLEKLSMLKIEDSKRGAMIEDLSKIVGFVDVLSELDTTDLDPSFSTLNCGTPMRRDIPSENREVADIILANAPGKEDSSFTVPNIIE